MTYARNNLVKFPLLIFITSVICSMSYYIFSVLITRRLSFGAVQLTSLRIFHDISILLAGLSPVSLFLAVTLERPDQSGLHEYPFFQGLNVIFIAICGALALVYRTRSFLTSYRLPMRKGLLIIVIWLVLSMFVGSQCAWYLRPFFGVATIHVEETPFIMGRKPDFRGATSFYEAVFYLVRPPETAN